MNLPIDISEAAFKAVRNIFETKNIDQSMGLRIGVKGSGCSGTNFFLGFDKIAVNDKVFEVENLKILIEKKHFLYLAGMKLDFVDNNSQRGFTFVSQN